MKLCPKCARPGWFVDDEFCYQDGEKLIEEVRHHCGRNIGPNDRFCPKCGEVIEKPYKPSKEALRADDRLESHLESMEGM